MPLRNTEFHFFDEKGQNISSVFYMEKKMLDSGLGMVFVNLEKVENDKIYNVNIFSNSFDDSGNLSYVYHYKIYFYSYME